MGDKVAKEHVINQTHIATKELVKRWIFSTARAANTFAKEKNAKVTTYAYEKDPVPARRGPGG